MTSLCEEITKACYANDLSVFDYSFGSQRCKLVISQRVP